MPTLEELYPDTGLTKKQRELREFIFNDFWGFMNFVSPHMYFGHVHEDIAYFFSREDASTHQLILIPREHLKSVIMAHHITWNIIKNPAISVLYASATPSVSYLQLTSIKNLLLSEDVIRYFPGLVDKDTIRSDGKWSQDAIMVNHPYRTKQRIRDYTVKAAGIGTALTGLHCDLLALDDIVAPSSKADPWSQSGRELVMRWVSQAASILNAGGSIKAIGTRYHPKDVYTLMEEMVVPKYDKEGNVTEETPVYEIFEAPVETNGQFLWPKKKARNGKYYGFDFNELAKKKAQYIDKSQFFAQYYLDANDPENKKIDPSKFQYYDRSHLSCVADTWQIKGKKLSVYAAIDIAATVTKRSDYTVLVIIGVDEEGFKYILDIYRLKTNQISVMADTILEGYRKWRFKKLRAETNAQQGLVVNELKNYLRRFNAVFSWDEKASTGNKELRIISILEPLYSQGVIFHFRGGNCAILEDELVSSKPEHDDISDALAAVNEIAVAPIRRNKQKQNNNVIPFNRRFGGVSFA